MSRAGIILAAVACMLIGLPVSFAGDLDGVRGPVPLTADHAIVPPPKDELPDERQPRASYDAPPIIPHSIIGYRLDAKENHCLSCHGRALTQDKPGAPMSISHFVDRNGKVSASLAPGRYFCTQCHVEQTAAAPPIGNDYQVFALPRRRYICLECHLPQPEDASSGAIASPDGTGLPR